MKCTIAMSLWLTLFASSSILGGNAFVAPSTISFSTPTIRMREASRSKLHYLLPNSSSRKGDEQQPHSQHSSSRSKRMMRMSTLRSDRDPEVSIWERMAAYISQSAAVKASAPYKSITSERDKLKVQLITLLRVGIPSIFAGFLATFLFPILAIGLATLMNDAGVFAVLSQDSSQFVQNFLTVAGLLFSILVGQTYYFMYQQQEAVYYALFSEVTEAKSLLEQVALVCQGRSMYLKILDAISLYVNEDLKRLQDDPAVLLSARPVDDPLESIMYMTSVGVPSSVYETVRSLRQERAKRLGALQRKLPRVHLLLLWMLAAIELVSFPLLGAGTQTIGGYNILTVEGCLFGIMTFGIVMTLRVVGELWRPAGGAYNVDGVLSVMVSGLEEELQARMSGNKVYAANGSRQWTPDDGRAPNVRVGFEDPALSPVPSIMSSPPVSPPLPTLTQGPDLGATVQRSKRIVQRIKNWKKKKSD